MPNDVSIHIGRRRGYLMSLTQYGKFWVEKTFMGVASTHDGRAIHSFDIEHLADIILKIKEDPKIIYDD